jgi:hypothetical protein
VAAGLGAVDAWARAAAGASSSLPTTAQRSIWRRTGVMAEHTPRPRNCQSPALRVWKHRFEVRVQNLKTTAKAEPFLFV